MNNLRTDELARLITVYCKQTKKPTLLGFAEWLKANDTSTAKNPYRYTTV